MTEIFRHRIANELLEDIAAELDIADSRYEAAERAYKSVGQWLERDGSRLKAARPKIYVQGSFALGTVTKPIAEKEHYDLDGVVEVMASTREVTQEQVKEVLGYELRAYAKAQSMNNTPERCNRCWSLEYADEAQFHMDMLPALPEGATLQQVLASHGLRNPWSASSIAITDERHPDFKVLTEFWLRSNPKGYAEWFKTRLGNAFETKRRDVAKRMQASVEAVPLYKVKMPLQLAIQILKRHRDIRFLKQPTRKPISIILTTLAACAYQQEASVPEALYRILQDMDRYIEHRQGHAWIANPSNPLENFADKWALDSDCEKAFYEWLESAREDFATAGGMSDRSRLIEFLSGRLGVKVVNAAAARRKVAVPSIASNIAVRIRDLFRVGHRQAPRWPVALSGQLQIERAWVCRDGFRDTEIVSNGPALPKYNSLRFKATTDMQRPFKIYWQVVNTGEEATNADGLRGGFDELYFEKGGLMKEESTLYTGTHWVECFIVKDGYLVARSGEFIVNIT